MESSSRKYLDILSAARTLFWKHGFKRVSVEEICQVASVSKMTFYKYFPNKAELAKEILNRLFKENMEIFTELMHSDLPFEEKMKRQIQMKLEGTTDISEEFIKDIYGDPESELNAFWRQKANEVIGVLIEEYRHAQEKGWIRRDLKIDFILYMINKTFEFVNDDALILHYNNMQELIMEINRFFLYGILPHDYSSDD
jgi:AcrR family transcriptional regulator